MSKKTASGPHSYGARTLPCRVKHSHSNSGDHSAERVTSAPQQVSRATQAASARDRTYTRCETTHTYVDDSRFMEQLYRTTLTAGLQNPRAISGTGHLPSPDTDGPRESKSTAGAPNRHTQSYATVSKLGTIDRSIRPLDPTRSLQPTRH